MVFRLLRSLSAKYAGLGLKNVDYYVSLQLVGTTKIITKTLGEAGIAFAEGHVHAKAAENGIDEDQRAMMISLGIGPAKKAASRKLKILIDSMLIRWQMRSCGRPFLRVSLALPWTPFSD